MAAISEIKTKIAALLEKNYQSAKKDQAYLLRNLNTNILEISSKLHKSLDSDEWTEKTILCRKLEALGINLAWNDLRQAGTLLEHAIENNDKEMFQKLLKKLDKIIDDANL